MLAMFGQTVDMTIADQREFGLIVAKLLAAAPSHARQLVTQIAGVGPKNRPDIEQTLGRCV